FQSTYQNTTPTDDWWRTNVDLPRYYSYQAIVQGIHHYDIADGKNYFFYRNPLTGLWSTHTWDIDLTWANNMYRSGTTGGDEPFKSRVLGNVAFPGSRPAHDQLCRPDQLSAESTPVPLRGLQRCGRVCRDEMAHRRNHRSERADVRPDRAAPLRDQRCLGER